MERTIISPSRLIIPRPIRATILRPMPRRIRLAFELSGLKVLSRRWWAIFLCKFRKEKRLFWRLEG